MTEYFYLFNVLYFTRCGVKSFPNFFLHHGFVIAPIPNIHLRNRVAFEDDEVGACGCIA